MMNEEGSAGGLALSCIFASAGDFWTTYLIGCY